MFENKKVEFLDSERKKIWERLTAAEKEIQELADSDSNASKTRGFLNKASNCYNKIKERFEATEKLSEELDEIRELIDSFNIAYDKIDSATKLANEIKDWNEDSGLYSQKIKQNLEEIKTLKEDLETKQTAAIDSSNKISSFHRKANDFVTEIEEMRNDILGYDYEDEESGEEKHVAGLQEKLTKSFKNLEEQIKNSDKELQAFFDDGTSQVDAFLENIENRYNEVDLKIKSLLPDALTAGLASAYEKKRTTEEYRQIELKRSFGTAIRILIFVAFIPFIISSFFIFVLNKELYAILQDLPRFVLTMLPIYIPCLWWAISANKSLNLSKRLVEEYLHKESLAKTFEGLSNQIENLENNKLAQELRIKLLYNFLEVSAENPGKLILDYNKSDNPILDIIDKSSKLGETLERFKGWPGVNVVLNKVHQKSDKKKEELEHNIEQGLSAVNTEEEPEE